MWKSWRRFAAPSAEAPGARLVALGVATVVAVVAGNLAPPERALGAPLLVLSLLAGWRGLVGGARGTWWWTGCGLTVGLAACAFAPRTPAGYAGKTAPVRFEVGIRDGWVSGTRGWGTRVRVRRLEWAGGELARPREMNLYVTAPVGLAALPRAGSWVAGSGEIVFDRDLPLAAGHLRVKTLLLLRRMAERTPVDEVRDAGVRALQAGAGADPARLRAAALAAALALQRLEDVGEGEVASLRRSGLVHLLSVSGLHVGLVGVLAWALLNVAGVPPAQRRWLVCAAMVGFGLLAGGNAPVRRAVAAGIAYLVARRLGRPLEVLPAVWGIVGALVLLEPSVLLQAGFQLSAFVTLALVRWIEPVALRLRVLPHRLAQALAVALVAQAASLPLVGAHFSMVPALGVAASLLAAPLELVLVGTSLAALAAAAVWGPLGGAPLAALAVGQRLLDGASSVGGVATWSFAPLPPVMAVVLAALGLAALTRARVAGPAALTLVALSLAWTLAPGAPAEFRHEVRMLGVREGMALLIRNDGQEALVDAGRSPVEAWRELARARVRRLDALVVTHPDADHTGGAALLLDRLSVRRFAYPEALALSPEIVPLRRLARLRGIEEVALVRGRTVTLGRARWEVMWPPATLAGEDNDASLVARVALGGPRLVIAGDLEAAGERALLLQGTVLAAEVLQLAHHGSKTSSTPAFLGAVRPLVALAATGVRPRFAYPDPTVARRVRAVPSVVVLQHEGVGWVGWNDAGRLVVGSEGMVRVARARRPGGP